VPGCLADPCAGPLAGPAWCLSRDRRCCAPHPGRRCGARKSPPAVVSGRRFDDFGLLTQFARLDPAQKNALVTTRTCSKPLVPANPLDRRPCRPIDSGWPARGAPDQPWSGPSSSRRLLAARIRSASTRATAVDLSHHLSSGASPLACTFPSLRGCARLYAQKRHPAGLDPNPPRQACLVSSTEVPPQRPAQLAETPAGPLIAADFARPGWPVHPLARRRTMRAPLKRRRKEAGPQRLSSALAPRKYVARSLG